MRDDQVHCFFDALVFASAHLLHAPILIALGALLYLAWRGLTLSSQLDKLQFLEALSSRVKDENIDLHNQLDQVVLERENLKDELKELKEELKREYERGRASYGFIKSFLRSKVEGALGASYPNLHERQLLSKFVESYAHQSKRLEMTELNEAHLTERVDELQEELTLLKVCIEEYKERDDELDICALSDLIGDALRDNLDIPALTHKVSQDIHGCIVEAFTRSTRHNL